jgi:hypothetical protein
MAATTLTSEALIDQLGSQPNQRALTTFLRRQERLWDPAVGERLYERVVRVARSDLRQAGRLADAAMWLAGKLEDDCCRAQSLRAMGHCIDPQRSEALERSAGPATCSEPSAGSRPRPDAERRRPAKPHLPGATRRSRRRGRRAIFERHGDRLRLARLTASRQHSLPAGSIPGSDCAYERAHEQLARVNEPQDVAPC